ncbi:MAG: hypothetical protein FJ301_01340 [Planctomycetes bacterium]|nr:hypothetical protein [Planctomycetota bacterium]
MLATFFMVICIVPQDVAMPAAPTAGTLGAWSTAIEPDEVEAAFRAIPWRNELAPAIEEAKALGRPILLWTMNGHPLGCT